MTESVLELQAVTGLFLVKFQVFTINSNGGFYDRVCNGICYEPKNMTDLYLEVQPFTANNWFCRSITL